MTAPKGLGPRGRALWRAIHSAVGDDFELDERELALLALACRQSDDVAALEREVTKHGRVVRGSKGQPRLSQVVVELRPARLAVARLLGQLSLPDEADEPRTAAGRRGQHAANVRWNLDDQRKAKRRGAA